METKTHHLIKNFDKAKILAYLWIQQLIIRCVWIVCALLISNIILLQAQLPSSGIVTVSLAAKCSSLSVSLPLCYSVHIVYTVIIANMHRWRNKISLTFRWRKKDYTKSWNDCLPSMRQFRFLWAARAIYILWRFRAFNVNYAIGSNMTTTGLGRKNVAKYGPIFDKKTKCLLYKKASNVVIKLL